MRDISRLKGLQGTELGKFRGAKIYNFTDLWSKISSEGVEGVQQATGIQRSRLVKLLVSEGLDEASAKQETILTRHWLDIAIILTFLAVILLFVQARAAGELSWVSRPWGLPGTESQAVYVIRPEGIPAYEQIRPEDVNVGLKPEVNGTLQEKEQVIGRFLLESVDTGDVIRSDQLSQPINNETAYQVLSIPLDEFALSTAILGEQMNLLLSPITGLTNVNLVKDGVIIEDVLILNIQQAEGDESGSGWIVAAVPADKVDELRDQLGSSQIYLLSGRN
jgi:hypothetical protein